MVQLTEDKGHTKDPARGRKPRVAPVTLAVFANLWFIEFYGMRYGLGPDGHYDSQSESEYVQFVPRTFSPISELAQDQIAAAYEEEVMDGAAVFATGPEGKLVAHVDLYTMKIEKVPDGGIPSERQLYQQLIRARTARRVRTLFKRSAWLQNRTKPYLRDFFDHADQFADALKRYRLPSSQRPSSEKRRLIFMASAMASITWGLSPITGIRILRKIAWQPPNMSLFG